MTDLTLCRIAVAALLVTGRLTHAQQVPLNVRELGSIPGFVGSNNQDNLAVLPNGQVAIYAVDSAIYAYNFGTKTRTTVFGGQAVGRFVTRGITVSPLGDRLAWSRPDEQGPGNHVWSMPIDPQTGAPTGSAGLVSAVHGNSPRFSPDGKFLAFRSGEGARGDTVAWVYVVPVTGGPERRIAPLTHGGFLDWSSDGKALFVTSDSYILPTPWVDRIPVNGGATQRAFTIPDAGIPGGEIWATDGRLAIYMASVPLMTKGVSGSGPRYVTNSGGRGELPLPPGADFFRSSWIRGSSHARFFVPTDPTKAFVLDAASGRMRELDPTGIGSRNPVWSEDGRRLAFLTRRGSQFDITVINKDGSDRRSYPASATGGWTAAMLWSPDGQHIAFAAAPRGAISVLDLNTGKTRALSSPTGTVHSLVWKRDSRGLLLVKNLMRLKAPVATDQHLAIYEVGLDGSERLVRDLSAEFAGFMGGTWVSDSTIALAGRDRRILVPVYGGPARELPGTTGFGSNHRAYVSTDGNRLLIKGRSDREPRFSSPKFTSLTVATTSGVVRTIELPFEGEISAWQVPVLHRGGNTAIVVTGEPLETLQSGGEPSKVYLVPLDGSSPRLLATLPGKAANNYQFQLSPDGSTLAFTVYAGPHSATIFDLDLSPILRGLKP